jgi:hypothetical protein
MSRTEVARETSSATTRLVLAYVRERAGDAAVERVLEVADVPHTLAELEDPSSWVSYEVRIRIFAAVVEVLDDPLAMHRVGATLVSSSIAPSLLLLVRALGSAAQVYRSLPRAVSKFSTTSTMTVLEATSTSATIRFELHEGYRPSRLDCDYARGLISTVPEVFGLPPPAWCTRSARPTAPPPASTASPGRAVAAGAVAVAATTASSSRCASSCRTCSRPRPTSSRATTSARCCSASPSAPPPACSRGLPAAVHAADGGPPLVHATGIPRPRSTRSRPDCWRGEDLGRSAVVVDVASARRTTAGWRRSTPTGSGGCTTSVGSGAPTPATPPRRSTCSPRSRTAGATVPGRRRCSRSRTAWPA